ncbi:uncharacterized protein LOC119110164 [Pollicipes pollicipes]|uniref:uncharacterized protein LOC119110164 n=1 Tax=Pollicipes pollicipes TaxID=41117 RepID=UPI001885026C|nr:uncharacterized protein LOC119110164 [Pollicipes pollicipes]
METRHRRGSRLAQSTPNFIDLTCDIDSDGSEDDVLFVGEELPVVQTPTGVMEMLADQPDPQQITAAPAATTDHPRNVAEAELERDICALTVELDELQVHVSAQDARALRPSVARRLRQLRRAYDELVVRVAALPGGRRRRFQPFLRPICADLDAVYLMQVVAQHEGTVLAAAARRDTPH